MGRHKQLLLKPAKGALRQQMSAKITKFGKQTRKFMVNVHSSQEMKSARDRNFMAEKNSC